MAKAFAIDLGATSAKCAFFDNNEMKVHFTLDTTDHKDLLEKIYAKASEEAKANNINMDDLDFVAVAVCGLVDNATGNVIYSTNLEWEDYPALQKMKEIFKAKNAIVLNDAKAATYGEWKRGLEEKHTYNSMAFYTLGTGIGGGAIFNGELVFGDNTGLPSEPGHGGGFQDEIQCKCGLKGCIEPIASATGIERKLNIVARKSNGPLGKLFKDNGEIPLHIIDVRELFLSKDKEVYDVFVEALDPLAKSISVMIHFFDISVVMIGGGPSNLGQPLLDIIKDHLRKYVLPDFYNKTNIQVASLKNFAGVWGLYEYGLDNLDMRK